MPDWIDILSRLGVPVGLLVAIVYGTLRLVAWLKPFVERALLGHIELIERCSQYMASSQRFQEQTSESLERIAEAAVCHYPRSHPRPPPADAPSHRVD